MPELQHEGDDGLRVVCFGAGRVAAPFVERLLRSAPRASLSVASAVAGEAAQLRARFSGELQARIAALELDVLRDGAVVDALCARAHCVVALVPEPAQLRVAQACVRAATPLVTASYASPELQALDAAARAAGVPLLCEMGLDPGMVRERRSYVAQLTT